MKKFYSAHSHIPLYYKCIEGIEAIRWTQQKCLAEIHKFITDNTTFQKIKLK